LHPLIAFIARTQSIAVCKEKILTVDFEVLLIKENPASDLVFKIILHPQIVVSYKHKEFDTRIFQFSQLSQHPHVTFGNHVVPLVPETEKGGHEKQDLRIGLYKVQAADEFLFAPLALVGIGRAKMLVGGKVY